MGKPWASARERGYLWMDVSDFLRLKFRAVIDIGITTGMRDGGAANILWHASKYSQKRGGQLLSIGKRK